MQDIDYDLLIKAVPEFSKYLLNKIEDSIRLKDNESIHSALEDYKKLKDVLSNNNIFYSEFDKIYDSLEKKSLEIPESMDVFNQRVMEDYKDKLSLID